MVRALHVHDAEQLDLFEHRNDDDPVRPLEARDSSRHTAIEAMRRVYSRGMSSTRAARRSSIPRNASITFARASSQVLPWLCTPGTRGTDATTQPLWSTS